MLSDESPSSFPGINPPRASGPGFVGRVLIVAGIALLALLVVHLRQVVVLAFGCVLVAVSLHSGASLLRRLTGASQRVALAGVVVGLVLLIAVGTWLLGEPIAEEFGALRVALPKGLDAITHWLNSHSIGLWLLQWWREADANLEWARVAGLFGSAVGAIGAAVMMLVVGIYLAADPGLYRRGVLHLMPYRQRARVNRALGEAGTGLSRCSRSRTQLSQSFQALGVSTSVVRALGHQNIHRPFAVQEQVLPDALGGLDILAEAPTGSGKTLAFGIPLVERTQPQGSRPAALVLVPTRELATQVAADLRPLAAAKNLRVAAVYGGTSVGGQTKLARGANILIATPGRLNDLLERKMINLDNVRVLVLDEADRMLDMGFKPQVNRILAHVPRNRQTLLFSATLDGAVAELARDYTDNASRFRAELPKEREKGAIEHAFVSVTPDDKLDRLVEHLNAERGLALVFVRTKHGADKLVKKLARQNVSATAMHGNMSQNQRERSLSRFESGKIPTLVATDVAARGLDIDDITHVINFDPPHGDEDYVHRVGRTGRAGRSGTGITFVLPEQQTDVAKLAGRLGHGDAFAASGMRTAATPRPKQRSAGRQRQRRRA